jgi:RNA polymerase sigma-70 factor (ECF subfamily)
LHLFSSRKQKTRELQSLTDEQLVRRYSRDEDPECLGILYERYTHLVFALCLKYLGSEAEAEDMVMMVFEKLFEELRKSEVQNFKGWLYTVARNQCLMFIRHNKSVDKSKQEILHQLNAEIMELPANQHLLPGKDNEGEVSLLENAILQLNESQKACIELFYLQEQSYKEVADNTGYSMNEVKSHIQNGKRNLRIFIEKARG